MANGITLGKFLTTRTNGSYYEKTCQVRRGRLSFALSADLRPTIYGLKDGPLHIRIVEEAGKTGDIKMLYGWYDIKNIGENDKRDLRTIMSCERKETWEPLVRPIPADGRSDYRQARYDGQEVKAALTQGLGKKVIRRWWKVINSERRPCVVLRLGREFLEVHGFRGRPKVWAVIREEQGKIKAYFYPDEREEA
ncbi:MAG: hypothetical protein PHG97_07705, partial [Candidatus Margulisbacteria bacterium]|nr:hypothetical protein [Candidatus Margulisiibacteriota bacterium]